MTSVSKVLTDFKEKKGGDLHIIDDKICVVINNMSSLCSVNNRFVRFSLQILDLYHLQQMIENKKIESNPNVIYYIKKLLHLMYTELEMDVYYSPRFIKFHFCESHYILNESEIQLKNNILESSLKFLCSRFRFEKNRLIADQIFNHISCIYSNIKNVPDSIWFMISKLFKSENYTDRFLSMVGQIYDDETDESFLEKFNKYTEFYNDIYYSDVKFDKLNFTDSQMDTDKITPVIQTSYVCDNIIAIKKMKIILEGFLSEIYDSFHPSNIENVKLHKFSPGGFFVHNVDSAIGLTFIYFPPIHAFDDFPHTIIDIDNGGFFLLYDNRGNEIKIPYKPDTFIILDSQISHAMTKDIIYSVTCDIPAEKMKLVHTPIGIQNVSSAIFEIRHKVF